MIELVKKQSPAASPENLVSVTATPRDERRKKEEGEVEVNDEVDVN